ncbi:MAG: redoxin family protein [Phycisphaerales bacterium]|nr:redoxin family protein [Phycisphaerales bacterium]MCI0631054.1 redoxin family protein [Phycisphaerales bacterium]MCI0674291.1 redoxin family protein [Phycisphaerales bacterium]
MNFRSGLLGLVAAIALASVCLGQEKKLTVGDPAPGLDIDAWAKGSQTNIEPGKVYVVEFWATWCGPCKRAIPHLTDLQKTYGEDGLVIIGVSSEESDKVTSFVRGQGQKMGYTVAIDRSQGTERAWMGAAGKEGIPTAFIVDQKSRIAYIGNPHFEDFDPTLKRVMSGRFDAVLENEVSGLLKQARQARKLRNWRLASKEFDDVVAKDAHVFAEVALEKFEMLVVDMNDRKQAYAFARNELLGKTFATDAGALQMLAEKIASDPKIDKANRDLDAALESAEAGRNIAPPNDAPALATLALVRFHRGEVDQAVELQKQAYFNALPRHKPLYKRTLTTYQDASERVSKVSDKPQ